MKKFLEQPRFLNPVKKNKEKNTQTKHSHPQDMWRIFNISDHEVKHCFV